MREILFRGKRIDNGEWVEGYYLVAAGMAFISAFGIREPIQVDGETAGQYTSLPDKNGKKIFEGDIGRGLNMLHPSRKIYQVVYEDNGFYYCDEKGAAWHPTHIENFEIIGNIHDNPELLEVSGDE